MLGLVAGRDPLIFGRSFEGREANDGRLVDGRLTLGRDEGRELPNPGRLVLGRVGRLAKLGRLVPGREVLGRLALGRETFGRLLLEREKLGRDETLLFGLNALERDRDMLGLEREMDREDGRLILLPPEREMPPPDRPPRL